MGITQDRKGFLWFSTESGLHRFDGNTFRVYKKGNLKLSNTITGNELNIVYADKYDDIIWIATQRNGLNSFDCITETFSQYQNNPQDSSSIITNDITNIINSRDGNLWITTYYAGFEYFDKKNKKFIHYNQSTLPELASNGIWSIAENKDGLVYIGHVDCGLSIFSPQTQKVKNFKNEPDNPKSLPGNSVFSVFIDSNDNIWLGTDKGLALFNTENEEFTVFSHQPDNQYSLISNTVLFVTQLDDGRLWIGTENGGISILNVQQSMFLTPGNIKFTNIYPGDDKHSLSNKTIRCIFQDSFKNVWIGTYGDGINFISNRKPAFNTWSYSPIPNIKNKLSHQTAWGICTDAEGRLWIGTDGGGIDVFENGRKIKSYNKDNSSLPDNAVLSAYKDSYGNLWFGTFSGGISVFNKKSGTLAPLPIENIGDVRCFAEDCRGNIWIGRGSGIHIYNIQNKKVISLTKENSDLREFLIRSILFDEDKYIWIGSFGEGISIYDAKMKPVDYFDTNKNFPSNMVNHIYKDKAGNVWVGTGDGLVLFRKNNALSEYIIYNEDDGLKDSHIRAITEDSNGNIWLSTVNGISQLNIKDNKFFNFNHYDGVPLGDFMSGSVAKMDDGTICFGSHNGLCYFNPSLIPDSLTLPPVAITEFKIYNNKVEFSEGEINESIKSKIILNHNQNSFKVSFNVLDYSLKHLVEYNYMLKGMEDIWYSTYEDNSVMFRNIPHGVYELQIKSRIRNQEWSDNITSLAIEIKPPLWLTWWAKTIYLLIIICIIAWIIRFYKRRLILENSLFLEKRNHQQEQELNNERMRFFTNITHELRTPLTLILGPLEDLQMDKTLSEKHSGKISVIYKSATRLLNLINQILEFRKTETQNKQLSVKKDNLATLIREAGLKYKELNTKENVVFNTIIENDDYNIYFDQDIMSTILENLLSNALKYTEEGTITLSLRNIVEDETQYTEIEVRDTGKGIHPKSISKIFDRYYQEKSSFQDSGTGIGLALVYNLVQLHQGLISVKSELSQGTTFCFRIKSDNKYPDAIHVLAKENETSANREETVIIDKKDKKESKPIVLIIEDNEEINKYIVDSLSEDYVLYSAVNGKDGIEKAYSCIPDVIVSDIMMPEIDGLTLTKMIKDDVRTSHIPIILLTAKDTILDRTEGYSIGAESYITKPFSANLLKTRIANLLESRLKIAEQVRNTLENKTNIITNSLNNIDKEFIEKIVSIIEDNIESEHLDVNFIADKMFMSHSSLYRKVKALTDMTVNEFIRKNRLRKAEQLLLTGKYTISEISYMVGINSLTYFRQCFKDEFGLAPTEYLKKYKR
jgi:signal transduction histidine kinase/ligand-binding sensor domain-containing protein/DNA-binding response OmpR family regulator